MKSTWQALIWKEWHEHKWKLAALTAVQIALPAMTLFTEYPDNIFGAVTMTLSMVVPMLAVFVGANAAASENAARTMPFLQSLPKSLYRVAIVKLIASILTMCIPVAGLLAFSYGASEVFSIFFPRFGQRIVDAPISFLGVDHWYLSRFLFGSLSAASLIIWVSAVGVNRSDEVRAGALGILAIACYAFLMIMLALKIFDFQTPREGYPTWFMALSAIGPNGPAAQMWLVNAASLSEGQPWWPIVLASIAVHGVLAAWFIVRFGRVSQPHRRSERMASVVAGDWLAPPRRTKLGALVWKQLRESGPLALIAMCMIFGAAACFVIAAIYEVGKLRDVLWRDWFYFTFTVWSALGFFVAIVAGVGVFIEELRPGIHTFWRSRPIDCDLWFWTKFVFGLAITLASMLFPLFVLYLAVVEQGIDLGAPDSDSHPALWLLLQATVFTTAALAMILVRQAIYAAVFAIAIVGFLPFLMGYFDWKMLGLIVSLVVTTLISTLLAWFAVRYDWSLRR